MSQLQPNQQLLFQQAVGLFHERQYRKSAKLCIKLMREIEDDIGIINLFALNMHHLKRFETSQTVLNYLNTISPNNIDILNNQAAFLFIQGATLEAKEVYKKIIALKPDKVDIYPHLIDISIQQNELEQAINYCDVALSLSPKLNAIALQRCELLSRLQNSSEAMNCYERLIEGGLDDANMYAIAAKACYKLGNIELARKCYEAALTKFPDSLQLHNNYGNLFLELHDYRNALRCYQQALTIEPNSATAFGGIGCILLRENRFEQAIGYFNKAISIAPETADWHFNLALALLSIGRFDEGWKEYYWHIKMGAMQALLSDIKSPEWRGESLSNKTLLIVCEQGLGDVIQFCRYISFIKKDTGKVILACQHSLIPLLVTLPSIDQVVDIEIEKVIIPSDFHTVIMNLPYVLQNQLTQIPSETPYLHIDPANQKRFAKYFLAYQNTMKVGICWRGKPSHRNDIHRSSKFELFQQLSEEVPEAQFFSLQKLSDTESFTSKTIINLEPALSDIMDTAAAISQLDLIITVDTMIAHLAGALNKPVWVLIPYHPDWRWMLQRTDSPWYPSMKLYRQPVVNDWLSVFKQIAFDMHEK